MKKFQERFLSIYPHLAFVAEELEQQATLLRDYFHIELEADFDQDFIHLRYSLRWSKFIYGRRLSLRKIVWCLGHRGDFHDLAEALLGVPTFLEEGVADVKRKLWYTSVDAVRNLAENVLK